MWEYVKSCAVKRCGTKQHGVDATIIDSGTDLYGAILITHSDPAACGSSANPFVDCPIAIASIEHLDQ